MIKLHLSFQPTHATVTVNPDGKSVKFQINPGITPVELTTETFDYSVGLVPSPGGLPLTANSTGYVIFHDQRNYSLSDGCQGGRRVGPIPAVTDGR